LGLALIAALCALGWLVMVYPESRVPVRGRVVALKVDATRPLSELGARLQAEGLVQSGRLWTWYARALGAGPHLRHGEVMLRDSMSARQLLQRLAQNFGSVELTVTLPEGFDRFEIADRLARWGVCERQAFLTATEEPALLQRRGLSGESVEGYLFPDTYAFEDGSEPREVVARLLENGDRRWHAIEAELGDASRRPLEPGWGRHQVLILASIVEKEAQVARERPRIAGVFMNRLRDPEFRPHRLQADPTVAYGCRLQPELASCAGFDGRRVTRAMTADPLNLYNTYRIEGLPPGPIANPGRSSIVAALMPEAHRLFYFVASGAGLHTFSESLEAHNLAVQEARAR
jgi:UPF0755 protein